MADGLRSLAAGTVVAVFLLYICAAGLTFNFGGGVHSPGFSGGLGEQFGQYIHTRVLSADELRLHEPHRRLIVVGDIHGMNHSLTALLAKVSYDPAHDTLLPAGDMLTQSTLNGSLAVLAFIADNNIAAVRGNHDQSVVGWRAWQDWVAAQARPPHGEGPSGTAWLAALDAQWVQDGPKHRKGEDDDEEEEEVARWVEQQRRKGPQAWWATIPDEWDMFDTHYLFARAMPAPHAQYLRNLPLVLHAPVLHTYIVHAGLLAYDPTRSPTASRQPLAHVPAPPGPRGAVAQLRVAQEAAILSKIPQNKDPWTMLNLRAVLEGGELSRKAKEGEFWADLWTDTMARCSGYDLRSPVDGELEDEDDEDEDDEDNHEEDEDDLAARSPPLRTAKKHKKKPSALPCLPASIVYGHTASRGLEVRRWSFGLDSGCVYGRRLTALVIDVDVATAASAEAARRGRRRDGDGVQVPVAVGEPDASGEAHTVPDAEALAERVRFGDSGHARIVDVQCDLPE